MRLKTPSELARPSPPPQAGILGVHCPRPGAGRGEGLPGGPRWSTPPPPGAQGPRPTEDPALPAHAGQPGLSADGNGRLLGRGDPGSALVREVAGTAGGPVCRAPLRWGSDLAPCPPPHRLGTPRLPRRTPSRCQWILGGRPRELPAQEGTQCPAPPGALGPCSAPPGWAGAQQHLQGKQAAPRSTFLRQPGQRRPRAPASRAGPHALALGSPGRDAVSARRAQPQEGEGEGEGGAVLRG